MKAKAKSFLVVMLISLVTLLAACGSQNPTSTPSPSGSRPSPQPKSNVVGVTDDTIMVGAFLPLTGSIADTGIATQHGALAYFNYVNEQGGVHGRKIKWLTEDDAYQPQKSLAAAKKLLESDKVFGIFSGMGTSTALATLPYLQESNALYMFPYAAAAQLTTPVSKRVFSILPPYDSQVAALVQYVIRERKGQKVAFVYQNTVDNKAGVDAGIEVLKKANLTPFAVISFEKGTTDFSSTVLQLQKADPDYVIEVCTTSDFARIIQEGASRNFKPQWSGTATAVDSIILKLIGNQAEGVFGMSPTKPVDADDKDVQQFRDLLKKYYPNDDPSSYNLFSYVTAMVFVEALKQAGSDVTQDKVVAALENMQNYDTGLMAPLTFSPQLHLGNKTGAIVQIKGGKFVQISDWIKIAQ